MLDDLARRKRLHLIRSIVKHRALMEEMMLHGLRNELPDIDDVPPRWLEKAPMAIQFGAPSMERTGPSMDSCREAYADAEGLLLADGWTRGHK